MKEYPPIPQSIGTEFREMPNAYVFDKLDGSNLRFEWSKKQGWHKYGTRARRFDESDWQFGRAIPIFKKTMADPEDLQGSTLGTVRRVLRALGSEQLCRSASPARNELPVGASGS